MFTTVLRLPRFSWLQSHNTNEKMARICRLRWNMGRDSAAHRHTGAALHLILGVSDELTGKRGKKKKNSFFQIPASSFSLKAFGFARHGVQRRSTRSTHFQFLHTLSEWISRKLVELSSSQGYFFQPALSHQLVKTWLPLDPSHFPSTPRSSLTFQPHGLLCNHAPNFWLWQRVTRAELLSDGKPVVDLKRVEGRLAVQTIQSFYFISWFTAIPDKSK